MQLFVQQKNLSKTTSIMIPANDPCPVCKGKLRTMRPAPMQLELSNMKAPHHDGDTIVITVCQHCDTLIEYNLEMDKAFIMRQETLDELEKTDPEVFTLLKLIQINSGS